MNISSPARGVYLYSCMNCGGPEGDDRLQRGLPCPRCLRDEVSVEGILDVARILRSRGALRKGSLLDFYARIEEEARLVEELFARATGSRLWSAQRAWVRRVLKGVSFAAIAPTGVGKTTFGIIMSLYFSHRGEKSYIVVPTTPLVQMIEEKLAFYAARAGLKPRVLVLHGRLSPRQRRERLERLEEGDFDVLVTTAQYLIRNADRIHRLAVEKWGRGFRFVFVDDVDAVLKSGRSVDAVLRVVGFDGDSVDLGWEFLRLQRRLAVEARRAQAEAERRLAELRSARRVSSEEAREVRRRIFEERLAPIYERLEEVEKRLEEAKKNAAVLVVSSATGRPRGARVRLFQALLGFQAGSAGEAIRNIVDAYTLPASGSVEDTVAGIVARLGAGGIVYVPVDLGVDYAVRLAETLRKKGVRAEAFTSRDVGVLERFQNGDVDVLVGVAIYYGVAVRGLDLPLRIRYAVFAGVPRHKISIRLEKPHPLNLVRLLAVLAEHGPGDVRGEAQRLLARLRRIMRRLSPAAIAHLAEELEEGRATGSVAEEFAKALQWLREAMGRSDVWASLEKAETVALVKEDDRVYLLVPDAATYIQASGRTSRLYAGGVTKGLSIVVVDDPRLFNGLARRTRWLVEAEWRRLEELDLASVMRSIDRDRERLREIVEGKIKPEQVELVRTALLIVESPNKARTIAGFFGRPSARRIGPLRVYEVSTGKYILLVSASGGHVYDLVKPETPMERITGSWLLDVLEGSVEAYDWSMTRNVHGILVSPRGPRRFLPVYAPIARCMACGHQWTMLPGNSGAHGILRCPVCGSPLVKDSWSIIEALRSLASEVDVVMVGTDPDTEGEKIGYDLASLIGPAAKTIVRIEFHEVTPKAIEKAIESPRGFLENLVEAQLVRRVEDRWIGFTLSPILWTRFWREFCTWKLTVSRNRAARLKSAKAMLNAIEKMAEAGRECETPNYNLSAGRVQTPVLGWIVKHTLGNKYLRIPLYRLEADNGKIAVTVRGDEVSESIKRALAAVEEKLDYAFENHKLLESLEELEQLRRKKASIIRRVNEALQQEGRAEIRVEVIGEEEAETPPPPPFTTDTLLAEASQKLGFPAPLVMRLAQDLFELGLITYHRTDSTRISDVGIRVAREYLEYRLGDSAREVFQPRHWGRGGAHEGIRPTRPIDADDLRRLIEEGELQLARPLTQRHYRLYDLVFKRFIASQSRPARLRRQRLRLTIRIDVPGEGVKEIVREEERTVEVIEPGWLKFYPTIGVEEKVKPGVYRVTRVTSRVWSPVQLLTQAEAVRLMKEKGIGRPSTYAKIIEVILRRGYAVSRGRGSLIATLRGIGVYDYLTKRFPQLVSEDTTRRLQETMDKIEAKLVHYEDVLGEIISQLSKALEANTRELGPETVKNLLPYSEPSPHEAEHV
ncbi:MAG: reverse gyrase [Hyperthermus sp.]|nr:MAG: reverse gyrase [Hyperthermus sp.]